MDLPIFAKRILEATQYMYASLIMRKLTPKNKLNNGKIDRSSYKGKLPRDEDTMLHESEISQAKSRVCEDSLSFLPISSLPGPS
jgi:hypothetical protein